MKTDYTDNLFSQLVFGMLLIFAVLLVFTVYFSVSPVYTIFLLLIISGIILILPIDWIGWDYFSPISLIGLAFLLRIGGPTIDIMIQGPENIDAMLGNDLSYLVSPLIIVVFGLGSFTLGFLSQVGEKIGYRLPRFHGWNVKRAHRVIVLYAIIGIVFFAYFISHFDITSIAQLSSKRDFRPTAYVRWFSRFLEYGAFIWFLTYIYQGKRLLSFQAMPMFAFTLIAMTYSIFTSHRGILFAYLIMLVLVYNYYRQKIRAAVILSVAAFSVLIAYILVRLRELSGITLGDSLVISPLEPLRAVFGANYAGITLISHIVNIFPEEEPFRIGTTFIQWIVYPIPSFIQKNQPPKLSSELAAMVYNKPNSAPPTIIGELWLNFWFIGVILGMLIFGVLARTGYEYLRSDPKPHIATVGLYAVFVLYFVFFTMTSSSVQMLEATRWFLPLFAALLYISEIRETGSSYIKAEDNS